MVSVAIDIVFAGLIAFVPNSTDHPKNMNVYLLDDPDHTPTLTLYGDVCPEVNGQCVDVSGPCHVEEWQPERGAKVICDDPKKSGEFGKIGEIAFDTPLEEHEQLLRRQPHAHTVDLGKIENRRFFDWTPRILSFQPSEARAFEHQTLVTKTRIHMAIAWESARTCHLDGGECHSVNIFQVASASGDAQLQPVAEEVMFTAKVSPGRFRIRLRDRTTKQDTVILRVNCRKNHCLGVQVENTFSGDVPDECDCSCKACPQDDHFQHYYDLARSHTANVYPVFYDCIGVPDKSRPEDADLLLRECNLQLLESVAPSWVKLVRKSLEEGFPSRENLAETIFKKARPKARGGQTAQERVNGFLDELFDGRKVSNRIVCPPAILEP